MAYVRLRFRFSLSFQDIFNRGISMKSAGIAASFLNV